MTDRNDSADATTGLPATDGALQGVTAAAGFRAAGVTAGLKTSEIGRAHV